MFLWSRETTQRHACKNAVEYLRALPYCMQRHVVVVVVLSPCGTPHELCPHQLSSEEVAAAGQSTV
jgi:hypothetical protein